MNRQLNSSVAALIVTLLVWAAYSGPTGTVKGTVSGAGGPVVGVRVVIASASDSSYTAVTTTDKEGAFSFSNAPVGDIEVKVYDSKDNFVVSEKGSLKAAGETITLTLRIP